MVPSEMRSKPPVRWTPGKTSRVVVQTATRHIRHGGSAVAAGCWCTNPVRVVIALCHVASRAAVTHRHRMGGEKCGGVLQVAIRRCDQRSGPAVKRFLCKWAFRSKLGHASWSDRSRCENAHMCAGCPIMASCSSLYIVANLCYRSLASGWRCSASLLCAIASSGDCGAASDLSESST